MAKATDIANEVAGKALRAGAEAAQTTAKRDPALLIVLVIGALAVIGSSFVVGRAATESAEKAIEAVSDRPTRDEMKAMLSIHVEHPHPGAVSRSEWEVLVREVKGLRADIRVMSGRIDRLLEK